MSTTTPPNLNSHLNAFNYHTGRPRFHFEEGAAGGAGGAGAAGDAGAAAAGAASPWHAGIDAEFIGHAQNKGWKLDDPKEAFVAAAKQARELERHFGVPPDRLVKLPTPDAKPEDLRAFYERLGAPKEAKDYDLSAVKDESVAEALRNTAHTVGLSKDAAAAVAKAVATAIESKATSDSTVNAQKLADQKAALKANWGDKFEFNQLQAMEGARKLGISKEAVAALERQIGYDGVMEAMRKIGANTREDTFVERGVNNTGEVTTREGAVARKSDLMADKAWVAKYLAGDPSAVREMTRINTLIDGEAA
jgi:hypothetical protein